MTVHTLSKVCRKCNELKEIAEYYQRPRTSGEQPGHYVSECKTCMRERGRNQKRLSDHEPGSRHEAMAIDYLGSMGVQALPGKALAYANVDVIAWGCVRIEVKLGMHKRIASGDSYLFSLSHIQQERGLLGDVVMLIVPRKTGPTFHLFDPSFTAFYRPDDPRKFKSSFYYRVGAVKPKSGVIVSYDNSLDHFITEDDMVEAQDRVDLIWKQVKKISDKLRGN